MAQERYWNKFADDDTFELSSWLNGILISGRYAGFDAVLNSGMDLVLDHETTGHSQVNRNGSFVAKKGIMVSNQGTVIKDDSEITLPISTTGVNEKRIDLIVINHSYADVSGGVQATYSVIEGSSSSTSPETPSVITLESQTIIGELHLPENCTDLNQSEVYYYQSNVPTIGNGQRYAFRDEINNFTTTQALKSTQIVDLTTTVNLEAPLDMSEGGNTFEILIVNNTDLTYGILPTGIQDGAIIIIRNLTGVRKLLDNTPSANTDLTKENVRFLDIESTNSEIILDESSFTTFIKNGSTLSLISTTSKTHNFNRGWIDLTINTSNIDSAFIYTPFQYKIEQNILYTRGSARVSGNGSAICGQITAAGYSVPGLQVAKAHAWARGSGDPSIYYQGAIVCWASSGEHFYLSMYDDDIAIPGQNTTVNLNGLSFPLIAI